MLFEDLRPLDATEHERTAALALRLSMRVLPEYAAPTSRKCFTQRQLMALVLLRAAFGLTYRGLVELLRLSPPLVQRLGLKRVPHFTTIESFANSHGVDQLAHQLLDELFKQLDLGRVDEAAMDSTGLSATSASVYFHRKKYGSAKGPYSAFVKLSVVVVCGLIVPCAMTIDWGPSADMRQAEGLLRQTLARTRPARLYADAGYDSERLHELCREELGVESFVPPVPRTRDGSIRTAYRSSMRTLPRSYGRRWHAETFMSGLKRTTGSCLRARGSRRPLTELALRVVGYALRR